MKRKICAFTGNKSNYLKMRSALLSLKDKEDIELKIISIGSHNLNRFGSTYKDILSDGFKISHHLYTNVEGNEPNAMAQSVGLGVCQIASILKFENPDVVLLEGDRYEVLSVAMAASLMNYVVAHLQGGEVSGTIDELIRHSVTKLSHIHFPATEKSKKRIIQMGEDSKNVFNFGCCFMDYIKQLEINKDKHCFLQSNFPMLNYKKSFGIIIQHPVTLEYEKSYEQMKITLSSLQKFGTQCVLVWPNSDSGAEEISRAVRLHNEKYEKKSISFNAWRTIKESMYLNLLYHSDFLIGNSSSGIREAHIYGIPVINIGSRQNGRERTKNVIDVPHDEEKILDALETYSGKKIYDENLYGDGTAGEKIAKKLETINLEGLLQKRFCDVKYL